MALITLQPGRWVLQAKAFVGTLAATAVGECLGGSAFPGQSVVLMDIVDLTVLTTIPLTCATNPSSACVQALNAVITGTMVGPSAQNDADLLGRAYGPKP